TLTFAPTTLRGGEHRFAVGSAGSAMLVLQTVWPALLLAPEPAQLQLQGGTHNPMAPCFHFIERAYAPLLRRLGAEATLRLVRHGFAPGGGGEVAVAITPPAALQPFDLLERGPLVAAWADCLATGVPPNVAARELKVLRDRLLWTRDQLRSPPVDPAQGPGNALFATLQHREVTEVFTAIGEPGRSAERVGGDVAGQVGRYLASAAALGPHLGDQWVLPLALAVWRSGRAAAYTCSELTAHALTHFRVIERFLPVRITQEPADGGGGDGRGGGTAAIRIRVEPSR
ncbi:MAG TPA: RNA 3'-terminal phosphate cyclase, partial [Burkholderiaceae bacterium]|nr:RNA 3'-terminal phosphate cyclase [Burkholderiaceae bacterium]